jgi:hypothetical protein
MMHRRSLISAIAAGVVLACASLASVAWAAGAARSQAGKTPPKPDVNVIVIVEPGVPKNRLPEKAYGHLTRKGGGNGQREGANDPGPPHGETGDGTGRR